MSNVEALGLPVGSSEEEIKKVWRSLASTLHPDRGGDPAEFNRMRKIYEGALQEASNYQCPVCNGSGKVLETYGWHSIMTTCPKCRGI